MKKIIVIMIAFMLTVSMMQAEGKKVAAAKVKNLKGQTINTADFSNDGKPIIVNFWATWCKPCLQELTNIHDKYSKWQKETGVKIIAVSIDDSRNSRRVMPFVKARGWDYDIYLDVNQDFKRAMNVNNPPHTFLIDGSGNIVYEHNGYAPGDEDKLYEKIKTLIKE